MAAGARFDGIVCLSPDAWGDAKRPEHLMSRLSEQVPVVYVEPPVFVPSLVRPASRIDADRRSRALTARADEVRRDVRVVTPVALLPEHRLASLPGAVRDALRGGAHASRCAAGSRAGRAAGIERPAWWFGEPHELPRSLDADELVVYDCVDRWSDFPGALADPWWRQRLVSDENVLLGRADAVLCSAAGLRDAVEPRASGRVTLVRNGADVEHFARRRPVPSELASLPRPILGFVGALAEWVDLDLVAEVARARPSWSIVLVGPVFAGRLSGSAEAVGPLRALPNVHLLGPRPYHEVPAYVGSFDVAMIPFAMNGLTADTNPIKLYEYLASGVPVVATPLPEIEGVPGVRAASDPAAFVAAAEAGMRSAKAEAEDRRRVAEANSWDERARAAWRALQETVTIRRRRKVLAVATDLPWPLDSGYRIRAFENLRAVADEADVSLLAFSETRDAGADAEALSAALPGVRVEPPVPLRIHIKHDPAALARVAVASVLRGTPYKVQKFSSSRMRARLRRLRRTEHFDAVHAELGSWPYAEELRRWSLGRLRLVLDEHNVESALLAELCATGAFGRSTPLVRLEALRTRRFEARACRGADAVVAISEEDARGIRAFGALGETVRVVPPVASSAPEVPIRVQRDAVLMVGQLSWLPNQEAVAWFCQEVLPLIRSQAPEAPVRVVGAGAPAALVRLMRESGVTACGYVDDISEEYAQAAVYVAPFVSGGGVRIKLLDAMRAGVPIVATVAGAKGLTVHDGRELLLAQDAEAFASAVCTLLADEALATQVASNARDYLHAHHSREHASELMGRVYLSLAQTQTAATVSAMSAAEGGPA